MSDERPAKIVCPDNDWGRLADDPFMPLSREDTEIRAVLKRFWTRGGGDPSLFDDLIPLDGPYGREPPQPVEEN